MNDVLTALKCYKKFQSPKGRLQTIDEGYFEVREVCFNPQRGGYKPMFMRHAILSRKRFNPQRGGYKHVQELDFIISRLYTPVNVFILKHLCKTQINPEESRDKRP